MARWYDQAVEELEAHYDTGLLTYDEYHARMRELDYELEAADMEAAACASIASTALKRPRSTTKQRSTKMTNFTRRFEASNGATLWFSGRWRATGADRDTVIVTTDLPGDGDPDVRGWSVDSRAAREFAQFFIDLATALDKGSPRDPVDYLGELEKEEEE